MAKRINLTEASKQFGRLPGPIKRQLVKRGVTPSRDGKYDAEKVKVALEQAASDAESNQKADLNSPRNRKLALECTKLVLEIKRLQGRMILVEEANEEKRLLCSWFKDAFAMWIAMVKVKYADAKMVTEAESIRNQVYQSILSKCEQTQPN